MPIAPTAPTSPQPTPLPFPLQLWCWIVVLCAVASCGIALAQMRTSEWHQVTALPHRFDDFMNYKLRLRFLHTEGFFTEPDTPYNGSGWGYPAPAIWIYRFFYRFGPPGDPRPKHSLIVMEAVATAGLLLSAFVFARAARRQGLAPRASLGLTLIPLLLGWPFFLALQRGNIESLLWLPMAVALWAVPRRHYLLAAVLIGIVSSAKIYPLILLAALLPDRRFREIAIGFVTFVAITLCSLWYIGPTFPYAAHHLGLGISGFLQSHGEQFNWNTEGFNHSLFHLIKVVLFNLGKARSLPGILPLYMAAAAVIMTAVYLVRVTTLPYLNQVTVLTVSMVFLPAVSYDYTLQILFLPWAWFCLLLIHRKGQNLPFPPHTTLVMALYAILFAPELFLYHDNYLHSGTLKSLCLGALLALACITPWPDEDIAGSLSINTI